MHMSNEIVQVGDPVLRAKAKALTHKEIESPEIQKLIRHMKGLLSKEKNGVGLAAPQVDASVRLFIVSGKAFVEDDETEAEEKKPTPPDLVFINPELIRKSRGKREMSEGCLSVRGKYGRVMRHEKASVRALNEHGKSFTYHGSDLVAEIFQHEMDHLDGILYIDKATHVEDEKERVRRGERLPSHIE